MITFICFLVLFIWCLILEYRVYDQRRELNVYKQCAEEILEYQVEDDLRLRKLEAEKKDVE